MNTPEFATLDDLKARYSLEESDERLSVLLKDACNYVHALYISHFGQEYTRGVCVSFDANACAVVCSIVARALSAPADMYGITQTSETVGAFSQSYTLGSAAGDMYLTKSERQRLGIGGMRIGSIAPKGGSDA